MRTLHYRAAALLVTGALLPCLSSCAPTQSPAVAQDSRPGQVVRAKGDDKAAEAKKGEDAAKEEKDAGDGFRFPDDKGGQMLAKVLPPAEKVPMADENVTSRPRRLPGSPALEHPSVPLGPNQGQVPRLPITRKGPPLRPRPLSDDLPLSGSRPDLPQEAQFPAGERVRLPGPDVNEPASLPVLAVPAPDRTSTDDPTSDYSSTAAQSATVPMRAAPAPLMKLSLPDPFENRDVIRLRQPPGETSDPISATPKPPMK